jgi:outer membrane protein assembly factor BamD (BamD/ComL family)
MRVDNRRRVSTEQMQKRIALREHRARLLMKNWINLLGRDFLPDRQIFRQFVNSSRCLADAANAIDTFAKFVARYPSKTWSANDATRFVSRIVGRVAQKAA